MSFTKPLAEIGKDQINELVQHREIESRVLDYKEALPAGASESRRDFLADVSSFANAVGGYLLIGVRSERDAHGNSTGRPEEVVGLSVSNLEVERGRLLNLIRTGVKPAIPGADMRIVNMAPEKPPVLLVHVPRSFNAPHMVALENWSRFFGRNSHGKYQLDVDEIRAAFVSSEALPERIRQFRADRLAKIFGSEPPVELKPGPKVILHVVPIAAFNYPPVPVSLVAPEGGADYLPLLNGYANDWRFNFDGLLYFAHDGQPVRADGYAQVFRGGLIEAVDASLVYEDRSGKWIRGRELEGHVFGVLPAYLKRLRESGLGPPVLIMLSLHGVRGCTVASCSGDPPSRGEVIDRDTLIVPEAVLQTWEDDLRTVLRSVITTVWQSGGWDTSPSYVDAGG